MNVLPVPVVAACHIMYRIYLLSHRVYKLTPDAIPPKPASVLRATPGGLLLPSIRAGGAEFPAMWRMFRELFGYIRDTQINVALTRTDREKGSNVADVHVYVTIPAEKVGATLEDIEGALSKLDYVSGVEVSTSENVVAVSFEGGKAEQEEIKRTIEETGYQVSRLSVRSSFVEERNLWDI